MTSLTQVSRTLSYWQASRMTIIIVHKLPIFSLMVLLHRGIRIKLGLFHKQLKVPCSALKNRSNTTALDQIKLMVEGSGWESSFQIMYLETFRARHLFLALEEMGWVQWVHTRAPWYSIQIQSKCPRNVSVFAYTEYCSYHQLMEDRIQSEMQLTGVRRTNKNNPSWVLLSKRMHIYIASKRIRV